MRAARGTFVFVNSSAGLAAGAEWSAYAASKFGLRAFADALRAEEVEHGVRVSTVYPSRTATPMQEMVDREFARVTGRDAATIRMERVGRIPMGRIEQPEEVAGLVSFLVGPDSGYITGEAFNITGGILAG